MVAQPRYAHDAKDQTYVAPPASHLTPADARHEEVESPAVALQIRLDAAIASGLWAGDAPAPHVDRWPGAARVAILLGGAAAGWGLVWQLTRIVLPA